MACELVTLPGGGSGIVCGRRGSRPSSCSVCGRPAERLCDFIVSRKGARRRKRCSVGLCSEHTSEPAPGKDLCPEHAAEWARMKARDEGRPVDVPGSPPAQLSFRGEEWRR